MLTRLEDSLLFLTLLFLPTQLGRHFWPQFSFIYSLKIDYLSPTIYFWDLLVLMLIFLFILQRKKVNKLALNLILVFILTQLVSLLPILTSSSLVNLGGGLVRLEQYLIAGIFGVYLASTESIKDKVYLPFSVAILGESILVLLQFLKGGTLGLWIFGERAFNISTAGIAKFDFEGRQFLRPYGTFPHPNVLACFLVLAVIVVYWSMDKKSKKEWLAFRVATALASLATLATVSRSGILAGLAACFYLLKLKWFIILLAAILLLSPVLYTRYQTLVGFDNLSLLRREELADNAWRFFSNSPLLGVGLNRFIPVSSQDTVIGPSRFLQPVHNIYLLLLSETGLIGFLGFALLVGVAIKKVFNNGILLFLWVLILFLGVFDHYFLTLPQGYRLFFLIWGISLSNVPSLTRIKK